MPYEQRVPVSHCAACRAPLQRGHRVRTAWILNRPIRRMAAFHEVQALLAKGDFELAHIDCKNPSLGEATVDQHVGLDTCGRCRKKITPGERVSVAFIVEAVEPDPAQPFSGMKAKLSGTKGEMVHSDCADPRLLGMLIA